MRNQRSREHEIAFTLSLASGKHHFADNTRTRKQKGIKFPGNGITALVPGIEVPFQNTRPSSPMPCLPDNRAPCRRGKKIWRKIRYNRPRPFPLPPLPIWNAARLPKWSVHGAHNEVLYVMTPWANRWRRIRFGGHRDSPLLSLLFSFPRWVIGAAIYRVGGETPLPTLLRRDGGERSIVAG